jgi:hypothetical protein
MVVQGIVESREDLAGLGRSVLRPYYAGTRHLLAHATPPSAHESYLLARRFPQSVNARANPI